MSVAVDNPAVTPARTPGSRVSAVIEVLFAFAATHLCFKAVKQLTSFGAYERSAGLNFTPGIIMALAACLCVALSGRSWRRFGLVGAFQTTSSRIVLIVVYISSFIVFVYCADAGIFVAALVFLGHVASTAIGEELFFRGYIQSRLNAVFGKPWLIRRIPVGIGLLLCAFLFGFLHALNTVDYFRGHYIFAWEWAGVTLVTGVLYGIIREKTGSVLPCIIAHGLTNVWILSILMVARQ